MIRGKSRRVTCSRRESPRRATHGAARLHSSVADSARGLRACTPMAKLAISPLTLCSGEALRTDLRRSPILHSRGRSRCQQSRKHHHRCANRDLSHGSPPRDWVVCAHIGEHIIRINEFIFFIHPTTQNL